MIVFLFSSLVFANIINFDIKIQKLSENCTTFSKDVLECKKSTCSIDFLFNNKINKFIYKISELSKNDECPIFRSFKEDNMVDVVLFKLNKNDRLLASKYFDTYLKDKNLHLEATENCCNSNPKEKKYCDIVINKKKVTHVFDPSTYWDCQGKNVFELKRKTIKY